MKTKNKEKNVCSQAHPHPTKLSMFYGIDLVFTCLRPSSTIEYDIVNTWRQAKTKSFPWGLKTYEAFELPH